MIRQSVIVTLIADNSRAHHHSGQRNYRPGPVANGGIETKMESETMRTERGKEVV